MYSHKFILHRSIVNRIIHVTKIDKPRALLAEHALPVVHYIYQRNNCLSFCIGIESLNIVLVLTLELYIQV